ncbi:Juxtamembrane domain-associated catenin [Echinococcus granulosus]|nr:Juxtamembrane domain-associated catenin [Echinococcus granulosus]
MQLNIHFQKLDVHNKNWESSRPVSNVPEAVLWQSDTVATFLALLRQASNPVCIEAVAGAIQNLTSSTKWQPAGIVRSEVRLQKGLSVLVDLLHFSDNTVVATVALTLRNLILEKEALKHLGKRSLPTLVACLTPHPNASRSRSLSSLASFTVSNAHLQTHLNCQVLLPILNLCSEVVLSQDNFTSHFVELGGVQYCKVLVQALSAEQEPALPDIHRSCCQAVYQLLGSLWNIKRLQPPYKEYGLTEVDFLQKKRSKLPQTLVHQSGLRRVPLTLAQRYEEGEERQRKKCRQARSYRPTYDLQENFQRAPSAASSSAYQSSFFSNTMRWKSEDTLQQFESPFGDRALFHSTNTAGVGAISWDGHHVAFTTAP